MSWQDPRRILARHGVAPRKSWSQNFLVSERIARRIAEQLEPGAYEALVELGPGPGTLTQLLLPSFGHVYAVEADERMRRVLQAELGSHPALTVVAEDAASVPIGNFGDALGLVGNLPYAITGAILRNVVRSHRSVQRAVIMVQREVGERLTASANTKSYGVLTVFVQAVFEAKRALAVPASAFSPRPKVDSAVIVLERRQHPVADPEEPRFRAVTRGAFGMRRKTLRNALLGAGEPAGAVDDALRTAGIDGARRGESLRIEELAELARALRGEE